MEEKINCDTCGVEITDYENGLFHHTGMLRGEKNTHIHLCAGCHNPALMEIDFDALLQQAQIKYGDINNVINALRRFNEWRRGGDGEQMNPVEIGVCIDSAINMLVEYKENLADKINKQIQTEEDSTEEYRFKLCDWR